MLSNFGGIGGLDAEQPGGVGIGIERIRCAEGGLTDVRHFAGNRCVDTCNYPYSKLAIGHVQREIAVTLWRNHRSRWGEIRKWAKKIKAFDNACRRPFCWRTIIGNEAVGGLPRQRRYLDMATF